MPSLWELTIEHQSIINSFQLFSVLLNQMHMAFELKDKISGSTIQDQLKLSQEYLDSAFALLNEHFLKEEKVIYPLLDEMRIYHA